MRFFKGPATFDEFMERSTRRYNNALKNYQGGHPDQNDMRKALKDVERALKFEAINQEDRIRAICHRGDCRYNLMDFHGALEDYQIALELDNTSASAWSGMGLAKLYLGNAIDAVAHLEHALSLVPKTLNPLSWDFHRRREIKQHLALAKQHLPGFIGRKLFGSRGKIPQIGGGDNVRYTRCPGCLGSGHNPHGGRCSMCGGLGKVPER